LSQGIGVVIWVMILSLPLHIGQINSRLKKVGWRIDQQVITKIRNYALPSCLIITDRPVYPFIAGCNTPPELTVTSLKLLESGLQSAGAYLTAIDQYQPKMVLLARFNHLKHKLGPALQQRGYHRVYKQKNTWLYLKTA